jgi:hypothetical protein
MKSFSNHVFRRRGDLTKFLSTRWLGREMLKKVLVTAWLRKRVLKEVLAAKWFGWWGWNKLYALTLLVVEITFNSVSLLTTRRWETNKMTKEKLSSR